MLLALPKPFERVQRIPVQKVFEQKVEGLHFRAVGQMTFLSSSTLDPEKVGYALTGDGNVVHVSFSVNHRIEDPVLYATQIYDVEPMLDHIVRSVALRQISRQSVDSILSDGREKRWYGRFLLERMRRLQDFRAFRIVSLDDWILVRLANQR